MADYSNSVLATGQSFVTNRNQLPEQRRKVPTVMELALKNEEFAIPNANELRKSPLRTVEISYFTDIAAGSATAKTHNHTGNHGDSGKTTLTYVTHVETFKLARKIAYNSISTYQQMFNNLYEMAWKNLRTRHDTSALSYLINNRVQLSAATMDAQMASANPGGWDDTNYTLPIAAANNHLFIQKAKSAMLARKMSFGGEFDIVAELQMADEFEYLMNQAGGNATNTSFQFANANISRTQDQIDDAYVNGNILILPKGMFAGMYYNEGLNKAGLAEDKGGSVGTFGTQRDPMGSGAVADVSMYTGRADTSANTSGGSPQDVVDQWEVALTIAYALPPLATASDSVVMQVSRGA